jgi:hypothetical protein
MILVSTVRVESKSGTIEKLDLLYIVVFVFCSIKRQDNTHQRGCNNKEGR